MVFGNGLIPFGGLLFANNRTSNVLRHHTDTYSKGRQQQ